MARIRTIKPSFWSDAKVAGLTRDERLLALGLVSFADDQGRFLASPSAISGYVFPHDDLSSAQIKRWRDAVARSGLIELYRVDGRDYGRFPKWKSHQRISHPQDSTLPEPLHTQPRNDSRNGSAPDRGTAPHRRVSGREEEEEENGSSGPVDPPRSEPNAHENGEGIDPESADPLTRLVADVHAVRPEWTPAAIRSAALDAPNPRATLDEVRSALLDVAGRADTTSPGRIRSPGPWWPTPPTPTPPPARDRLRGTPELDPERNLTRSAQIRSGLAARKPEESS